MKFSPHKLKSFFKSKVGNKKPTTVGGLPDYTYKDIYGTNELKRGKKPKVTSKTPTQILAWTLIVFASGIFLLLSSFLWVLGGKLFVLFRMAAPSSIPPNPVYAVLCLIIPFYGGIEPNIFYYGIITMMDIFIYSKFMQDWKTQNEANDSSDINFYTNDARIYRPNELPGVFDIVADSGVHYTGAIPNAVLAHIPSTNDGVKKIWVAERYKKIHYVKYLSNGKLKDITRQEYENDNSGTTDRFLKGDFRLNENGQIMYKKEPMFDTKFMQALWTASEVPKLQQYRVSYNPKKMPYNPRKVIGKPNDNTVAQHINKTWTFPYYERQRPGGYYIVDTQPSNTMMLAMTRAGKGQTYIEPLIDMWTRCKNWTNVVINDPKGELYVKFFYPANRRGFQVIAFNLINVTNTSHYNPLDYAVDASRHGDNQKIEQFVGDIGDTFFPKDKKSDPMWPDAANAAFKRTAFGLIDYYQDMDTYIRQIALKEDWDVNTLRQRLDKNWSHVTPNYVYQMMTQLSSVTSTDPNLINVKPGEHAKSKDLLTTFFDAERALPQNSLRASVIREDSSLRAMAGSDKTIASVYGISLTAMKFFADDRISALTSCPPSQNFDMAGLGFPRRIQVRLSEVYMDKHDLRGESYRWSAYHDRGFKNEYKGPDFHDSGFVDQHGWMTFLFKGIFKEPTVYLKLQLYERRSHQLIDVYRFSFTKDYKKTSDGFTYIYNPVTQEREVHGGIIHELKLRKTSDGSMQYVPAHTTYKETRYSLINSKKGPLTDTITRPDYVKDKDGNVLMVKMDSESHLPMFHKAGPKAGQLFLDPNGEPLKNYIIEIADNSGNKHQKLLSKVDADTLSHAQFIADKNNMPAYNKVAVKVHYGAKKTFVRHVISQVSVHYTEKPKMVFFITPPHLMAYAKVILILLNQMFNYQVSMAYLAKPDQLPLYETRYMLDEVGNLRSGGKGIPFLQTKESIGLGQGQFYTLILQTLQQLKDIYGDSVDKILTGNTHNIVFLQSTDPSLLKTLSDMSGTVHRAHYSKSIQRNLNQTLGGKNSPKMTKSISVKAEPLITQNMLRQNPPNSSIIFGHRHVIRAERQLVMPMSWRLHKNQLQPLGKKYTLKTIPNESEGGGEDILSNQPDFYKMVQRRVAQAHMAPTIIKRYKAAHGYNDADLAHKNQDILSKQLMESINQALYQKNVKHVKSKTTKANQQQKINDEEMKRLVKQEQAAKLNKLHQNVHVNKGVKNEEHKYDKLSRKIHAKIYANGQLSKADLIGTNGAGTELNGSPTHTWDVEFANAYDATKTIFSSDPKFKVSPGGSLYLRGADNHNKLWIASAFDPNTSYGEKFEDYKAAADSPNNKNVKFTTEFHNLTEDSTANGYKYQISDSMYYDLVKLDNWDDIADGEFNNNLGRQVVLAKTTKSDETK